MTDPRLVPANGRVAALRLKGTVDAERFVEGEVRQIARPVAPIWKEPAGRRERELLFGEQVTVYDEQEGFAFVQSGRDGYVGYVEAAALGDVSQATHAVCAPATHLYAAPDIKRPEVMHLSFGARLRIVSADGAFFETDTGRFVPKPHVRPANRPLSDPATVAQLFFGTPYLWGGNSSLGIDCSGLVQAAHLACGIECPADSDMQEAALGEPLAAGASLRRGDLLFWRGHVAMAVDPATLIHANAHHMAVAYEGFVEATTRIEAQGGGPVTSRRRVG